MNSEQIANNVKRLRIDANDPTEAIQTINALVELVGDMAEAIANNGDISWIDTKLMLNFATVAALKENV